MRKSRALFVVVRDYGHDEGSGHVALAHRIASKLSDFRSLGYRIIGILKGEHDGDVAETPLTSNFDFDELHGEEEVHDKGFPDVAWTSARRYSLNVRSSLLCSSDPGHASWASDAGVGHFEASDVFFG